MFGAPGEENLAVLEVILDSKIHFLQTPRAGRGFYGGRPRLAHRQKVEAAI